jgi:hypothetical protein
MPDVKWMDFSGAPPILIPESLLAYWSGFYLPLEAEDLDLDGDLELPDGRKFFVCDDFDFSQPQTDYDRICAGPNHSFVHPLGSLPEPAGDALVIVDESDGTVGWCAEQQMLITLSRHLPSSEELAGLEWTERLCWEVPAGRVVLMNPCLHGEDPAKAEGDHCFIDWAPGKCSIMEAYSDVEYCVRLYRFCRVQ